MMKKTAEIESNKLKSKANIISKILASIGLSLVMLGAIFAFKVVPIVQATGGILISKSVVSNTVTAGDVFEYQIAVTNTYTQVTVVADIITDVVPSGVTVINLGGGGTNTNGAIVWTNESISASSTRYFTFSVQSTLAGALVNDNYSVESSGNVTFGAPLTVTIVAGPPSQVSINAAPNPNQVGNTTLITVSLADQYSNPILSVTPVTLTYSAGQINGDASGTFVGATDTNGYLVVALDGITQPQTLSVNAQADTYSNFVDVVYTHGPPTTISLNASPASINVQTGQSNLTATITDQYGNLISGESVLFQTSLGHLNYASAVLSDGSGHAFNTLYADSGAGTAIITITVGALTDSSHTVNITPGPPAQIFMSATPITIPVSSVGAGVSQISTEVQDQYGNLVEPTVVTFTTLLGTLNGGGTTITDITVGGHATPTLTAGEIAGYARVTAQVGGNLQKDIDIYFQPDVPASLSLTAVPTHIYADGSTLSTIYANVYDQFGNPADISVDVDLSVNVGTIMQTPISTTNGVVTTSLQSTTDLLTATVTATATGIATPATTVVTFTVGAVAKADISLSSTSPITVGVPVTMTVIARDGVNHPVPNAPITLTTDLGWLSPNSGITDGAGQLQLTLESTRTGTALFGAQDPNHILEVVGTASTIFNPDASVTLALNAALNSVYANGLNSVPIVGTLLDRFGNQTKEAGVTPTFTSTRGTLNAPDISDSNGVVNRLLTTDTSLGDAVVSVTDMLTPTAVTITFTTGPIAHAYLHAVYTDIIAGNYVTLYITPTDSVGHLLPNQIFTVTRNIGGDVACSPTDGTGVLVCTSVLFTKTETAQFFVNDIATAGETVTVSPAPPVRLKIESYELNAISPFTVTAGQPYTFTATVYDLYDNIRNDGIIWDDPIQLVGSNATGYILYGIFVGEKMGDMRVLAHSGSIYDDVIVHIKSGSPKRVKVTPNPSVAIADGHLYADLLTIEIRDEFDNPAGIGEWAGVSSSLFGSSVEGFAAANADGIIFYSISSVNTGITEITVNNGGILTNTPDSNPYVEFVAGIPAKADVSASTNATHFEWVGSTLRIHANGVDTVTLQITILDWNDNAVQAGYPVSVVADPDTLLGSGTTDANGVITRTMTAPTFERTASLTVTYSSDLGVIGDKIEFFIGALDTININPLTLSVITAGYPVEFSADEYDIAMAEIPPGRLTYLWGASDSSNGKGIYLSSRDAQTATFMGTTAGPNLRVFVYSSDGSVSKLGEQYLTVLPTVPVTASISVSPTAVEVGITHPFTITLSNITDVYGNTPLNGEPITVTVYADPARRVIAGQVVSGTIIAPTNAAQTAGVFTISAESKAGQLALLGDNTITFLPGSPTRAEVITATPPNIIGNNQMTGTIVLQLQDQYYNSVGIGFTPTITVSRGTILTPIMPLGADGNVSHILQSDFSVGHVDIYLDGHLADGVPVSFIPGPPVSATVIADTTVLTVGAKQTQVIFNVWDEWHHPVGNMSIITPTLSPNLGWFQGLKLPLNGIVTQTLISLNQSGVAVAHSQNITLTGDITYTFQPEIPGQVLIIGDVTPITVGNSITVTSFVMDIYSNTVLPGLITMSTQLGTMNGSGTQLTDTTALGSGAITVSLYSEQSGLANLAYIGEGGDLTVWESSDVVGFLPDVPQTVTIEPFGNIVARAGIPITITVSSRDRFGNATDDFVHASFPWNPVDYLWHKTANVGDPGYGILADADAYGHIITFTPHLEGQNVLWATGGIEDSPRLTVTVISGYPDIATVILSPTAVLADGQTPFTLTVTNIQDMHGNPINNGMPISVTVPSVPPMSVSGIYTAGVLTVVMTTNTHSGMFPIQIEGEGHQLSTILGDTHIIFLPGPPVQATIDANPLQIPADTTSFSTLGITILDQYGNPILDSTPISVTTNLGSVTGAGATIGGHITRTLNSTPTLGMAHLSIETPIGVLEDVNVSGDDIDFVVGAPKYAWLDAAPQYVVADGMSTSKLHFQIKDTSYFDVQSYGMAAITTALGEISPTLSIAMRGAFTVTFTAGYTVSPVDLNVSYDGNPMILAGEILEQVPGPPVSATLTSVMHTMHAGEDEQSLLTITLWDSYLRPIMDGSVVTVTNSLNDIVTVATTTTHGIATAVLTPGTVIGNMVFTVTVHTPWNQIVTIAPHADAVEVVPGSLAQIIIHPVNPLDVTAGDSVTLIAVGYDAFGNDTGQRDFSWRHWTGQNESGDCGGLGCGDGILTPQDPLVDSYAVFTGTLAGSVGIKAYTGTLFSSMLPVTVHPGAATTATVVANPKSIYVGGETSNLIITIKDAFGNLVDNPNIYIVSDLDTILGNGSVVNGVTTRTLQSSIYYGLVNIYVESFEAGGDKVAISPRAVVTANPSTLLANNITSTTLQIQIYGTDGQLVTDGTNPTISSSLGVLSGSGTTVNGVLTRTLRSTFDTGVSDFYVDGNQARGVVTFTVGSAIKINVDAIPNFLPADGSSQSLLTFSVMDDYGHIVDSFSDTLAITATAGILSAPTPTISGVATRTLTAENAPGKATLAVDGWSLEGDIDVFFLSGGLIDGDFESGTFDNWARRSETFGSDRPWWSPNMPSYAVTILDSDIVGGKVITPYHGTKMARLGATVGSLCSSANLGGYPGVDDQQGHLYYSYEYPDNCPHQVSEAWINQSFVVPSAGVSQVQYRYRVLGYDVEAWDPFEVYRNDIELTANQRGIEYSNTWYYDWYTQNPSSPQDTGWQFGYFDVTSFTGQVVNVQFRVANRISPMDNTWVYLDNVRLINTATPYNLNISAIGDGQVTASPDGPYYYGDVVTLTAVANSGWHFDSWAGDEVSGTSTPMTMTIRNSQSITATFMAGENYNIFLPLVLK